MTDSDVTVVEAIYGAFARGDVPAVLAAVDPGVDWLTPSTLPWSRGAYHGREGLAEYFASFAAALEDARVEPHELYALPGRRVVAFGVERARARSTGAAFEVPFVHVFTVADGRVTAMRGLVDTAAVGAAFGVSPITGSGRSAPT
jgi:ketosteroid isomerase-like protein